MNKRLKEPPPRLSDLIILVNGLPPMARTTFELSFGNKSRTERELRSHFEVSLRKRMAIGDFNLQREQDAFIEVLELLPMHVREFIGVSSDIQSFASSSDSRTRYDWLVVAHKLLQDIATTNRLILEILQEEGLRINEESFREFWSLIGFERSIDSPSGMAILVLGTEGKLESKPGFLNEALVGVEIARIRLCPICDSFFWAGRIDASCCSREHANRLRTQRWNKKYLEKYKQQRIKKYQGQEKPQRPQTASAHANKVRDSKKRR
ncbi:MAG TPA: hypothetical protein VE262_17640 [Blastocatellia bacterium]|nr:hypothetical protein [Blastocatellia bacterium]